jgi:hypothetical protein
MRLIAAVSAVFGAAALAAGALAQDQDDYRLVLDERAGSYRYLESSTRDCCTAYSDALKAYGPPTHLRRDRKLCLVTWRDRGVKVAFAGRGCTAGALDRSAWYGLRLFGRRWHTTTGLRLRQRLAGVRRTYPQSSWQQRGGPRGQPWLVLQRRVVNGVRYVALAGQFNRRGRLVVIHVPAAYVY